MSIALSTLAKFMLSAFLAKEFKSFHKRVRKTGHNPTNQLQTVVCLRGGKRGNCLGLPFLGTPLEVFHAYIFLNFGKKLLSTHIIYSEADHK